MPGVYGGPEASRHGGLHSPSLRGAPTHFDDQDFPVFLGRAPALHIPKGAPASPLGLVYHLGEWARGFPLRSLMRSQSDRSRDYSGPPVRTAPPGVHFRGRGRRSKGPWAPRPDGPRVVRFTSVERGDYAARIDVGFGVARGQGILANFFGPKGVRGIATVGQCPFCRGQAPSRPSRGPFPVPDLSHANQYPIGTRPPIPPAYPGKRKRGKITQAVAENS